MQTCFKMHLVLRMFKRETRACMALHQWSAAVIELQHRVTQRICQRSPSQHTGSWDRITGTQSISTCSILSARESLCPVRVPRIGAPGPGPMDGLWESLLGAVCVNQSVGSVWITVMLLWAKMDSRLLPLGVWSPDAAAGSDGAPIGRIDTRKIKPLTITQYST